MTYVHDLRELYRTTENHVQDFGDCDYASSEHQDVQFTCYGALVFLIAMPRPPYSSLSIKHLLGPDNLSTHFLLGHNLTFVENTEDAFKAALEVVREFSRLRLPDKYLDAWEAAEHAKKR